MTPSNDPTSGISEDFIEEVRARLRSGQGIRRSKAGEYRLHIDRPLPFLCVYRRPIDGSDAGTANLVEGEASFLAISGARSAAKKVSRLVGALASALAERFGEVLIVEVWSAPDADVADAAEADDIAPTELKPDFVIRAPGSSAPLRAVDALKRHLERITLLKQQATARVDSSGSVQPPGLSPLVKRGDRVAASESIGICVRPIYRDHETGEVFPAVLRSLKRGVGRALKQAFFSFAKTRTTARPEHYFSLGRRAMVKAVREVDGRLSEVADSFSFLLQATPVNAEAAWHEFRRRRFQSVPRFYYRPLSVDSSVLKRRLFDVPLEKIEDPTLAEIFRQRQDELDRKITMLTDIGSPRFLLGSQQVYGRIDADLLELAKSLLWHLPSRSRSESKQGELDAEQFRDRAQAEVAFYRRQMPEFTADVVLRPDMYSGMMCSGGDLLIGKEVKVPAARVEALIQHEIGTHLVTYYNGLREPFQLLHTGFAGYDALQEGLAVLAEFLVGELSVPRLRVLAARVVASALLVEGASFVETFRALDRDHDFAQRTAYTITMRTYRGGGLTKDAVYLRGLVEMLDYIRAGGDLDPLFVGKIASEHIPLVRELKEREIVRGPRLLPRYLEFPEVRRRLERVAQGATILDLAKESSR